MDTILPSEGSGTGSIPVEDIMHATEGIVLKKIDAGEADAFFVIYTKDFGKIKALATGIKKENAKLKGHLEPLSMVSIQFVRARRGERLTHAELTRPWHNIRSDLHKSVAALAVAEIIEQHCFPGERDEALWETILEHFSLLERGTLGREGVAEFLAKFRSSFFEDLGYGREERHQPGMPEAALLY